MRLIAITFILWILSPWASSAYVEQEGGSVTGRVIDQTGAVLPGVAIDLVTNRAELTTVSDERGVYGSIACRSALPGSRFD